MKTRLKNLSLKAINSEFAALGSLIAALLYNIWLLLIEDPFIFGITHFVRNDEYVNHHMLLIWALLIGLAVFLNMNRMYKRTDINVFFMKLSKALLGLGLICLVVTSVFIVKSLDDLHAATAILFGIFTFASVTAAVVGKALKNPRYIFSLIVYVFLVYNNIIILLSLGQMAIWEALPILESLVMLFIWNFTDFFGRKDKTSDGPSLKRILSGGVVGIILLTGAVIIEYVCSFNSVGFFDAAVNLGRIGKYGTWDFELIRRAVTGAAVIYNIYRLYVRARLNDKLVLRVVTDVLLLASTAVLAAACYYAYRIMNGLPDGGYTLLSEVFDAAAYVLFFAGIIKLALKNTGYAAVCFAYLITAVLYIINIVVIKDFSLLENIPILSMIIFMFFTNYTDFFKNRNAADTLEFHKEKSLSPQITAASR